MDDQRATLEPAAERYRCPGEGYEIDRSVHLARLAAFYPACRACSHRHDVQLLSRPMQRQWAELEQRTGAGPLFTSEGLEAPSPNEINAAVAHRFATALAIAVWRRHPAGAGPPIVLVGAGGHWSTADLVAAACQALQVAGCDTIEAGALTSASLAIAARHSRADAALWLGNARGQSHSACLKVWGAGGRPWSSPGDLDPLREIFQSDVGRPKRRGGSLRRAAADELYLSPLRSLAHALRPLRLVLDTTCQPLAGYLGRLTSQAACQILRPPASLAAACGNDEALLIERRLARLGREVIQQQAHFGLWVSGDGEACRLVDERGVLVDDDCLCMKLAMYVCRQKPDATLVLHEGASAELEQVLSVCGAHVFNSRATRQAMFDAMESSGAVFGSGPCGQFWFAGEPTVPDALLVLCLLLTIFSQSDRAVSEAMSQDS